MNFIKPVCLIFSLLTTFNFIFLAFEIKAIAATPMSENSSSSSSCEVIVNDTNNDTQIVLNKNNILIVKLLANLGTGYGWEIVKSDRLQPLTDSVLPPLQADEVTGASEIQIFRFVAQNSGRTILELHYLRAWEKNVPPLKTYRLNIEIR
ncbi:MAG: protease inhibitor I42 family protein [Pseudanabaena sp.]|jgi:inhibitor of cysteine peptidase